MAHLVTETNMVDAWLVAAELLEQLGGKTVHLVADRSWLVQTVANTSSRRDFTTRDSVTRRPRVCTRTTS